MMHVTGIVTNQLDSNCSELRQTDLQDHDLTLPITNDVNASHLERISDLSNPHIRIPDVQLPNMHRIAFWSLFGTSHT